MITFLIFATAYMVKGGWLGKIQSINDLRTKNKIADRFLDGKLLGVLLVFLFVLFDKNDFLDALVFALAWILAVHPSMGEESGAIGRIGAAWGQYIKWMPTVKPYRIFGRDLFYYTEGRWYGLNKALQRGAWIGAVFTVAGATILSIPIMGIGFVAAHFVAQELYWRIHGKDSWAYAEPIIGFLFGLCYIL